MKKENERDPRIDELLKKTLKDDLPPEVESAMKRQLNLFQKKMEEYEPRGKMGIVRIFKRLFEINGFRQVQWIFKKGVPVFVSILMMVLGSIMQMTGSQSVLAESISALSVAASVSQELDQIESMECSGEVFAEKDKPLQYSIQWLSSNKTRVLIEKGDKIPAKTIWFTDEEIIVADHEKNRLRRIKHVEQIEEPLFQHLRSFLSPSNLVEQMEGKWRLKHSTQQGDCERWIFTVTIPEEEILLEISIDLCTYLPVDIKKFLRDSAKENRKGKILMNAHFKWNTPIPAQIMLPKITEGD